MIDERDPQLNSTNAFFATILQSCPNLKSFQAISFRLIIALGVMNLDFRGNHFLECIKLDMQYCQYYTFHHEFGKYLRNGNEEIRVDEYDWEKQRKRYTFSVHLAWNTSKTLKLELKGCKL